MKPPKDINKLAKSVVDRATAEKDPAAVALGSKGGKARAEGLSDERKSEIARMGAEARWKKGRKK